MKAPQSEKEAFELIELAVDDIEVLARAFDVINEVCREFTANDLPAVAPVVADQSTPKLIQ